MSYVQTILRSTALRASAALVLLVALAACLPTPAFAADGKVNVNSAGVDELTLLPRVGPAIAQRIVEHRDDNGPFESLDDLMLVRGIGERTFALIEPYAALSGETTLTEKVRTARAAEESGEPSEATADAPSN